MILSSLSQRAQLWRPTLLQSIPGGTWRLYNVASTSKQRHDVEATLYKRHVPAGMPYLF